MSDDSPPCSTVGCERDGVYSLTVELPTDDAERECVGKSEVLGEEVCVYSYDEYEEVTMWECEECVRGDSE